MPPVRFDLMPRLPIEHFCKQGSLDANHKRSFTAVTMTKLPPQSRPGPRPDYFSLGPEATIKNTGTGLINRGIVQSETDHNLRGKKDLRQIVYVDERSRKTGYYSRRRNAKEFLQLRVHHCSGRRPERFTLEFITTRGKGYC